MDIAERNKLIKENEGLVWKIARQWWSPGMDLEDIAQEGFIGLMKAFRSFNPEKGTLSTRAAYSIKAYIAKEIIKNYSLVRIGKTQGQRKALYHPEIDNQSRQEIDAVSNIMSLDAPAGEDGPAWVELLGYDEDGPLDIVLGKENRAMVLDAVERFGATLAGLHNDVWHKRITQHPRDKTTLAAIGKEHGICRENVRQHEAILLRRFRQFVTHHGLCVPQPQRKFVTWTAECEKCGERSYFGSLHSGDGEFIGVDCHKCGAVQYLGRTSEHPIKIEIREYATENVCNNYT